MIEIQNYVNGEFTISRYAIENENPALGEAYSTVPHSSGEEVDAAVQAAKKAFPLWSGLSAKERCDWVYKLADKIEQRSDLLAKTESQDNGKPLSVAKTVDIPRCSTNFRFFADYYLKQPDIDFDNDDFYNKVDLCPLGPVGIISPWNLPLYLLTWKIAPAIVTGNTVVAKPSEITPMTAFEFCKILDEIKFPKGVINIVHGLGDGAGAALVKHKDIKAISFTGSTGTGRQIAIDAAETLKKVSLEMGGKNPTVVFDDCDFDLKLNEIVRAAFSNNGQICLCGSRIYIQSGVYEKFRSALIEKVRERVVGDPMKDGVDQGAIVSKAHYEKILSYFDIATQEGGKFLAGGQTVQLPPPHDKGYFIKPAILENLPLKCRTNQEEIFGPVATIQPFETEDEALALANGVEYGLSASVWTKDIERGKRMAKRIDAGVVWINTWMTRDLRIPFGGFKASGLGREGGRWGIDFFTQPKNISWPKEDA